MDRFHLNEHDANQGAQSKGEFLGMTGNSGWYLLGSAGASILLLILFWGVLAVPLLPCLLLGLFLCGLSVAYVFTLKNNKPEHYDTDFFESTLIEAGLLELAFGPRSKRPANPFAGETALAPEVAPAAERRRVAASHTSRASATVSAGEPERPSLTDRTEAKRIVKGARPEPVVALAAYENLREELDSAEELLEDALAERGEN